MKPAAMTPKRMPTTDSIIPASPRLLSRLVVLLVVIILPL
jgi:hypothetical protein